MSKLRHSITSAHAAYKSGHYKGSLADELGVRPAHRHGGRVWRWAALAALIAVGFYLFRADESTTPRSPSAPQQAQTPNTPNTLLVPELSPANETTPVELADDTIDIDDSSLAMNDSTSETDIEDSATEAQSLQFSAPPATISFSNITGWSGVSISIPALGGLPTLDSSNSTNQQSTNQESAS